MQYGFAVREKLLEPDFVAQALARVVALTGSDLPLEEWTDENVPNLTGKRDPVFARIYDQPRLCAAIDELFGDPYRFNNNPHYQLFHKPRHPGAAYELSREGHIDFESQPAPALGSGFMFQASLVDKEPFGGNLTVWPGTHKLVQKAMIDNPGWRYPGDWHQIPLGEPFEFVAQAGDVIFFHHLVAHNGNPNATRMPRVGLHCQALQDDWLIEINPADPGLGAWERSLAHNGPFKIRPVEMEMRERYMARSRPDAA